VNRIFIACAFASTIAFASAAHAEHDVTLKWGTAGSDHHTSANKPDKELGHLLSHFGERKEHLTLDTSHLGLSVDPEGNVTLTPGIDSVKTKHGATNESAEIVSGSGLTYFSPYGWHTTAAEIKSTRNLRSISLAENGFDNAEVTVYYMVTTGHGEANCDQGRDANERGTGGGKKRG
jgi:hypothetical protein